MSQRNSLKRSIIACEGVASSSMDCNTTPHKRRRQTIQALEALGTLIKNPSVDEIDNKLNKNDILSLTLTRLLRQKYWPSNAQYKNVELAANIENLSAIDDLNGFIVVCNTNGRIILLSDNVELYLRKNVRSLYPQLTSIYNCVSEEDHPSIRDVLSRPSEAEQRIICKWKLPRGKRPSRTHTETKTMLMTGHFFTIDGKLDNEQNEPLFVARCEQILSSTPNIPANSTGSVSTTTIRLLLNEQLNINEISPNTETLLGYKADELIDQSLRRIVATEHIDILEQARQQCTLTQHYTAMHVVDLYTRHGDRLSFLCNIHIHVEGRRKAMKLGFLAQLIDPSATQEFMTYAHKQNMERLKATLPQDSVISPKTSSNNSTVTNILHANNEQCLNLNDMPTVCPAMVLPQRRKRRRVNTTQVKIEPMEFFNNAQQSPDCINDSNESHASSSESASSSASPIQEVGLTEELFPYIDDTFEYENIKLIHEFPSIDDINYIFGLKEDQQYFLSTPTVPSLNFFP